MDEEIKTHKLKKAKGGTKKSETDYTTEAGKPESLLTSRNLQTKVSTTLLSSLFFFFFFFLTERDAFIRRSLADGHLEREFSAIRAMGR